MTTAYGANIPVMRQGTRFGGENNGFTQVLRVFGFCFLLIAIQSCSVQTPKLNHHYLPKSYSTISGILSQGKLVTSSHRSIILNDNKDFNDRVVRFWERGYFKKITAKEHPYINVNSLDINTLNIGLNKLLDIYYVTGLNTIDSNERFFLSRDQNSENCRPLSNHEIQFMMNRSSETVFPSISLTMLIVSSHELMLLKGGVPVYPDVLSTFLRKRFQLPALYKVTDANVFAEKFEGKYQPQKSEGFVFCRKESI